MLHRHLSGSLLIAFMRSDSLGGTQGLHRAGVSAVPPRRYGGSSVREDAREPPPAPPAALAAAERPRCAQRHRY
ncbi:hypothetical protein Nmel_000250, partial [Mimus melanotis]